jgi:hypothetical protein
VLIGLNEVANPPAVTVGCKVTIKDEYGEDGFRIVNQEVSDVPEGWRDGLRRSSAVHGT